MSWLWATMWACDPPEEPRQDEPSEPGEPSEPTTTSDPVNDALWEELSERVEDARLASEVPGMQVAVVLEGELRYMGSFGVRTWDTDRPVTDETRFRWASVSKMHTATAALQLVEEGLVELDAPVTDLVPYFQVEGAPASSITLRHLLTHTSGLPDMLDWSCDVQDAGLQESVEGWELPLHAPPGSFYNYSNTGFSLAGALIEEVTGQSFVVAMQERVLDPSGMERASFDVALASDGPHADGTTIWEGEPFVYELESWDCAVSRPAAWLHGTASDLAQTAVWQLSPDGGGLLSPELIAEMHDQIDTGYWSDQRYRAGMGQFTELYHGERLVLHDGWVTGFTSMWIVAPDRGFGVAIVANADWADPYALAYEAVDLFLGLPQDPPPDDRSDPSTWGPFQGTYDDPYTYGRIEVELRGERLWASLIDRQTEVELEPYGATSFWAYLDGGWVDVRFVEDDTGVVRWFVTRYAVGTRSDGPLARRTRTWQPPPRPPLAFPRPPGAR
jgi:CubicO group peptidase (beta-lactamase class C family)